MKTKILSDAQEFESTQARELPSEQRPLFHLTPFVGWMNDPNGFSQYNGKYHLFYQYYPYLKKWGPMHWGHAVSEDLLRWEYLPCALAPDTSPDAGGCFSGSAEVLEDGRHLLMYTGVVRVNDISDENFLQTQCIAVGDGVEYEKYSGNPVIGIDQIPSGSSKYDFRDPKIWKEEDGTYRCVAVTCVKEENEERKGRVLLFRSDDAFRWEFVSVLAENDGSLGTMWECPDFFELDGKNLILVSPQDVISNDKYFSGNITVWMSGEFDREKGTFIKEEEQLVDYGIDFYATQTLKASDGRRIMTAWMQNWDSITYSDKNLKWFGQMIVPRELSFRGGKLIQKPVRELETLRTNPVVHKNVRIGAKRQSIEGIGGRTIDLTLDIRSASLEGCREFEIRFAESGDIYTALQYRSETGMLKFDRSHSGNRRAVVTSRKCPVIDHDGRLKIRMILDRYSCEIFVNDGEAAMSNVLYTDQSADKITFSAKGDILLDIEKYDLNL